MFTLCLLHFDLPSLPVMQQFSTYLHSMLECLDQNQVTEPEAVKIFLESEFDFLHCVLSMVQ